MRVLVTGANGFIGMAVGRELIARGHKARGDGGNLHLLPFGQSDAVIHLAAITPGGTDRHFHEYVDANVCGTIKVARECEAAGIPMLYAATRVTEGDYGRSKATAERIAVEEYGAIPVRVSMAYGPGQEPPPPWGKGKRRLIPTWVCAALTGQDIIVTGDPDAKPDLVYIDDVARAYAEIVEEARPGDKGVEVFTSHTWGLLDIARYIALYAPHHQGPHPRVRVVLDRDDRPDPPEATEGSYFHGGAVQFPTGLISTVAYYRERLGL